MNKRKYDRLDYVGNARYIVIDIYPHKSEVKISANNPYVFDENDVLNQTAIDYYKSLYDYGVRLHKSADNPIEDNKSVDNSSENTDGVPIDLNTDNQNDNPADNSEGIPNENSVDNDNPIEDNKSVDNSSENTDGVPISTEATKEEMVEFLDLTYDDESIKAVARESGINRIMSAWDKQEIISKIIETNSQYVINLMKNQ